MVRAIMHGCNGKMGQVISELAVSTKGIEIVAGVDLNTNVINAYPVYESIADCREEADVIIDFTGSKAVDRLLKDAAGKKLPIVLCSTGLTEEQLNHVHKASHEIAILRSANMSLGVNILFKLVAEAARILTASDFDIEIVERHHNQKIDAPSGTALALADSINQALEQEYSYKYDRTKERVKREKNEIGIHAVRGGTIVGEHEVIFAGIDEVVEFKHTAYSKAIFAKGAISAAKYLAGKEPGLYEMSDIIE